MAYPDRLSNRAVFANYTWTDMGKGNLPVLTEVAMKRRSQVWAGPRVPGVVVDRVSVVMTIGMGPSRVDRDVINDLYRLGRAIE